MGADKKKSKKKKEGGGGFGIAKMFGLDGKKKKKFKKERDDKKKGPMHSISPFQKNGTKLIANAEFYDFSPMPCVCLNCCNSELVQERSYFRVWDNRMEINKPWSPLCCLTPWSTCVEDSITVTYFDKSPVRQSGFCLRKCCGPPVVFLYRPKCLCFDWSPCFGETIMATPTNCWNCKQCCIFGTPCYSNRVCCLLTSVLATGVLNGNVFMHEWKMSTQRYRRLQGLEGDEMAQFKVVDGFCGPVTIAGDGRNTIDEDSQAAHSEAREERKKEEQRTGQKVKVKRCCFCLPPLPKCGKKTVEEQMFDVYMDYEGKLVRAINMLQVDDEERDLWVRMWMEIDEDRNNEMSFNEFTDYFQIANDEWARRTFMMINQAGNGVATLAEFITFCTTYIIVDRHATEEFAFRLMSRRNATQYNPQWSCLGIEDVRGFVGERYNCKSVSHRNKMAFSIFKMMDQDGDGGLDIEEWHAFCENNDAFARFAHSLLHHLRKCIFGNRFWVERTRLLMTSQGAKGGDKCNRESEVYCTSLLTDLEEPLVDSKFRIVDNKLWPRGAHEEEYVKAVRPTSTFLGEFDMSEVPSRPFEEDMAEVHELLMAEKAAKKAAKEALMNKADELGTRGHDLMRNAILDLIHQRRPLRWAFEIWCKGVGMESKPGAPSTGEAVPETTDDKDAQASAMARHAAEIQDVHLKIIGVTEKRKKEADETVFENYLQDYNVDMFTAAAVPRGDRVGVTKALYGADGPVLMTDIYRKQGVSMGQSRSSALRTRAGHAADEL